MKYDRVMWVIAAAGATALLIALPPILESIASGSLFSAGSVRTIYERASSPDGAYEARVQFDDGGAVSRFSRLVFIKPHTLSSDEPSLSCRAFWGDGQAAVHLRWLGDRILVIHHAFPTNAITAQTASCEGVRIVVRQIGS